MQQYAIKFSGQYSSRIAKTNAASGTSGIVGVGIVGLMIVGGNNTAPDKDERYINCFLTKQGGMDVIVKRPGMATNSTPRAGHVGSALLVWTGSVSSTDLISALGNTDSNIYNGITNLGAITGKATSITETFVSTVATLVVPSSDNTAWYYDTGVGVMTKITDGDFPGNVAGQTIVGSFAHMDGFACIMTSSGRLYAPNINSVTAWTANSFESTNAYPDKGVGCVRYKNLIIAFGTESMQFFQNAGLTPFPFINVSSMTQKIGAVSADAIAQISDTIFFAGSTPQGGLSIFQYDGQVSRISNPEQDLQFLLAGPTNISLTTERYYGRSFVVVVANATTYVYCIEDKRWHERTSTTPLWYKSAGLSTGSQILTYCISKVSTSGKVFVINPANLVFNDDGFVYTATIQSGNDSNGTSNRKFYSEFRLDADIEPSTSIMTIAYSDDDYVTFTNAGTIDLNAQTKLTRLGSSSPANNNNRAWKMTHSSDTAFRVKKAHGTMTVGQF